MSKQERIVFESEEGRELRETYGLQALDQAIGVPERKVDNLSPFASALVFGFVFVVNVGVTLGLHGGGLGWWPGVTFSAVFTLLAGGFVWACGGLSRF